MARRYMPLPYRQGELDGLCGIYAIINAIRLALGSRAQQLPTEAWQELYSVLMLAADDTIGAATAAGCGINTKPLLSLLKVATEHMADEHELTLIVRQVLKRKERPPLRKLLPRLATLASESNAAVLIALHGHLDHWTVLKKVGATALVLFDSSGFARAALANCRMSYERSASAGKREHVIHPRAVFRIAIER